MVYLLLFLVLDTTSIKSLEIKPLCRLEIQINPADIHSIIIGDARIYMTVLLEGRVFVFDREGRRLADIGRKGQGPNEFMYPMAMVRDQKTLYVLDNGKSQLIKIHLDDGAFLAAWPMERANKLLLEDDTLYASFNTAYSKTEGMFGKARLAEPLTFKRVFFSDSCCLDVKGAKSGGMAVDRNGDLWCAYSGQYRLEKYSRDDHLLKIISEAPTDYVVPSEGKASRFNRKAMTQHFRSFDKIGGLFSLGDLMVVYRYKHMDAGRLDFYDLQGQPKVLGMMVSGMTVAGVHKGKLFGYRALEDSLEADVELVELAF